MSVSQLKMMTSNYDRYCKAKMDYFQDRNYERFRRSYPNRWNVGPSFAHTGIVNQSTGRNIKLYLGSDSVSLGGKVNNIKTDECSISRNNDWMSGSRRRPQVIQSSLKNKVAVFLNWFIESKRNAVWIDSGCFVNLISEKFVESLGLERWKPRIAEELEVQSLFGRYFVSAKTINLPEVKNCRRYKLCWLPGYQGFWNSRALFEYLTWRWWVKFWILQRKDWDWEPELKKWVSSGLQ